MDNSQRRAQDRPSTIARRRFLALGGAFGLAALAGCTRTGDTVTGAAPGRIPAISVDPAMRNAAAMYGPMTDGGFFIPAVPYQKIDRRYYRQLVPDPTGERPGTVVVNTGERFLYLVRPGGEAVRYGVGIGRQGFSWSGRAVVQWKQPWPRWFPPEEMILREPELAKYSADNGGMEPGLDNPLGARALYIFQNGVDTLYRIHGSPEWASIGKAVSSGCVRLMNQDIIDLYERVPEGSPVVVI